MLPKISLPLFDLTIPSTQKKIKFRPFLVKEEKILLIAQEGGNYSDILDALKQIIGICIIDEKFSAEELTTFDLEYIFTQLRSKSVNNMIKLKHKDNEDEKVYDFEINLDNISVTFDPENDPTIKINDEYGIVMKYPSAKIYSDMKTIKDDMSMLMLMVNSCIDKVYGKETVEKFMSYSEKDRNEFIDNLDIPTFNKIRIFFNTLPKMTYKIEYKNSLGKDKEIVLSSLTDFFTFR